MTDDQVAQAEPERLAMSSMHWHPLYGDRSSSIVAIAHRTEPVRIRQALYGALLTDDELSAGQRGWDDLDDPFGVTHADPCDDMRDEWALPQGTDPPAECFMEAQDLAGPNPDYPGQNPDRGDRS